MRLSPERQDATALSAATATAACHETVRHNAKNLNQDRAMPVTEQQILDALATIADPERGADIVSLGMVSGVAIRDGNVAFSIEVEPERGPRLEPMRRAAEQRGRCVARGAVGDRGADRAILAPQPWRAAGWPVWWSAGGKPAAARRHRRHRRDRRGRLGQGRCRQVDRGGQSGARAQRRSGSGSACSTPTSMARRCRACSEFPAGPARATARRSSRWRITGCA